jgi:hypothetical protein
MPKEKNRKHKAKIEEIRRDPEKINSGHGSEEEREKIKERDRGWVRERQVGEAHKQNKKQEQ